MSKFPSANLLSILAMQDRITKAISPLESIIQSTQQQFVFFKGADAIARMMIANNQLSGNLRGMGMISRMFNFRQVPQPSLDQYTGFLAMLTNQSATENTLGNTTDDNLLLEVEYELSQIGQQLTKEEPESKPILLNQVQSIRKIILDIYKNHHQLLDVTSRQFEEMIAELLSNQGFKVELTKQTRDGGYDIIAICDFANQSPQKWLVECKRLTTQKVGVEVIRSFKEVVQANNVNRGIIATTSYFSLDALKKQQETPYLLDFRDKDAVMDWIIDYGNQKQ